MKVPSLEDVHIIFHHKKAFMTYDQKTHYTYLNRGYTICKIYRGQELIGEGRADCSLKDINSFSRPFGRALSMKRAFSDMLTIDEKSKIFDFVANLPGSQRYFQGRRRFYCCIHNDETFDVHIFNIEDYKPAVKTPSLVDLMIPIQREYNKNDA
jgi:hypothetical protein